MLASLNRATFVFSSLLRKLLNSIFGPRLWIIRFFSLSPNGESYFLSLMLGMLARLGQVDGKICNRESQVIDHFLSRELGLLSHSKLRAMRIFSDVRHSRTSFDFYAQEFAKKYSLYPGMRYCALDLLFSLALADGLLTSAEEKHLKRAARAFSLSDEDYKNTLKSFKARATWQRSYKSGGQSKGDNYSSQRSKKSGGGARSSTSSRTRPASRADSYSVLGCTPSDDLKTVKSAYRKLVKRYHPDSLRNQGLPQEMMDKARERFLLIQEAWEDIESRKS